MKKMKKLASILLAAIMVLAMAVPAMATDAPEKTYTITINKKSDTDIVAGHTYNAYQIFSGRLDNVNSKNVLSDIEWGSGVDGEAILVALKSEPAYANCKDAAAVAKVLGEYTSDSSEAKAFAKIVNQHLSDLSGTTGKISEGVNSATISGLKAGYYLVKDADDSLTNENLAYTEFILQVVDDVEISPKADVPSVTKKVKEKNDTDGSTTDWQDGADYDIGDMVEFKLEGTLPSNYGEYTTYKYQFNDTLSTGLTFTEADAELKVYVNSTEGDAVDASNYHVSIEKNNLTITFDNLKAVASSKDDHIIVTYKAKLNDSAAIGQPGNPNKVNLTFSNNPNGTGEGQTPDDTVEVFTFKLVVKKVDAEKQALKGAGFTLYKEEGANYWVEKKKLPAGEATEFIFDGLDSGDYKIVESEVPAGYNKIEDITFTVKATYDANNDIDPKLTNLEVTDVKGGNGITVENFIVAVETGTITTDIVNQSGAILPETGGIGTTIFYVLGSILVLGAVILLVTKKRMSTEK